jgi:hypothetical protein
MTTSVGQAKRWTSRQAAAWADRQPWILGCNFISSNAINQLEMWQESTFDPVCIDRELGWARQIGYNTVRVYLHDLLWKENPKGFKERLDHFLGMAQKHGIRSILVLFDDCWNDHPALGKQPEPKPGIHNSGWVRGPGSKVANQPRLWGRLERYVKGILEAFGDDSRVLLWDVYNEPGNSGMHEKSLPLLKAAFQWARDAKPSQPLSSGIWYDNKTLNKFQLTASDIITFHNYLGVNELVRQIVELKLLGRPLICTEYMKRPESRFATHLPILKKEKIGAVNWGLVKGKTQTCFPWGSPAGAPEPKVWFHDVLHPDGTPFDKAEIRVIQQLAK